MVALSRWSPIQGPLYLVFTRISGATSSGRNCPIFTLCSSISSHWRTKYDAIEKLLKDVRISSTLIKTNKKRTKGESVPKEDKFCFQFFMWSPGHIYGEQKRLQINCSKSTRISKFRKKVIFRIFSKIQKITKNKHNAELRRTAPGAKSHAAHIHMPKL